MTVAQVVNGVLVPFDVTLTRRSALDRTLALPEEAVACRADAEVGPPVPGITSSST